MHGLYHIANEQPRMAAIDLKNYFEFIAINPSNRGYFFFRH